MKTILHVGCGGQPLPEFLDGWREVRMDIDEHHSPDIVADLRDMGDVGPFDAVYGSHVLEHFHPNDVKNVLRECRRVLNVGGYVLMVVPNLEGIQPTRDFVYESAAGPITGLDMYYGKESFVEENPYMAHKTGFVPSTLSEAMGSVFERVDVRVIGGFNLLGSAVKLAEGDKND